MKDDEKPESSLPSLHDIISFPRISIEQLKDVSKTELSNEVSPAIWFALDDKNKVWYAGQTSKLCSLSTSKSNLNDFYNNSVSFIAYWLVNEKGRGLENLLKKVHAKIEPPLNKKKTGILMSTTEGIIDHLNENGITKKEITEKLALNENTFNNLPKNGRNITVLTLEKLLLSEFVTEDIFKELFIKKVEILWNLHKKYTNDEQQLEVDNNTAKDAVSDKSKKKENFCTSPERKNRK